MAEDLKNLLHSRALTKLRSVARRSGDFSVLSDYMRRHGVTEPDVDDFHQMLAEQARGMGYPFHAPIREDFPRLARGSFPLGIIGRQQELLRLDPFDLVLGLGVVGGSRQGKTICGLRLALHLDRTPGIGVLIPDLKGDYQRLVNHGFQCIEVRDLPFNFLEHIPGTDIEAHCWEIGQQLGSAYYLQYSETMFSRTLLEMFRRGGQPTLEEFQQEIWKLKSGKATGLRHDQVNALRGRIDQLCMVVGRSNCRVRHGFQPHKHASESIVFGLNLGDPLTHSLFVTWLDYWLFKYNKTTGIRPNRLRIAIIADESSYLLFERPAFTPYINELCALHGEFGVGLIGLTQMTFSTPFQANCGYKVLLPVGDARLFRMQADAMGLTSNQRLWAERNLGVGNAIVSIPHYHEPLPVALLPLEDEIPPATEQQVQESTAKLRERIRTYANDRSAPEVAARPVDREPTPKGVAPGAMALLKVIAENGGIETVRAYALSNVGNDQGNEARDWLEKNELINSAKCRIYSGRGNQPTILEVTAKGIDFGRLHYPKLQPESLPGKGGLEHRAHQHLVARFFRRRGDLVKLECQDADLGVYPKGDRTWFAVEIANDKSANLAHRVIANAEAGASKTLVVWCGKGPALSGIKQLNNDQNVEVATIDRYLLERAPRTGRGRASARR